MKTNKQSYTPGPWRIDFNGEDPEFAAPRIKGNSVENVAFIPAYEHPRAEMEANARLIAAAPDLLKTLIGLERGLNDLEEMCRRIVGDTGTANLAREKADWCRAAIAKATGAQLPS